jgi:hypothetical protein
MKKIFASLFPLSFTEFRSNWRDAIKEPSFRLKGLLSLFALLAVALYIPHFFLFIQARPGHLLNDVFLNYITPRNVSWFIFPLMYGVIALCLINISSRPELLMRSLQAYTILMVLRMIVLYLTPLEPERMLIPLEDPFIGRFFYSGGIITKDLFFSGHVSTMFLLVLLNPVPRLRNFLLLSTILIAAFILIQHVHYTIDVVAAPLFAWVSYLFSGHVWLTVNRPKTQ